MSNEPLLLEIGCEEIPARMIPTAATELARRIVEILDRAGIERGSETAWGGSRRLAVRVDGVQARQEDRKEWMTGPPASVAFDADGKPTRAALGFAKKQGITADLLTTVATEKGEYVGFRREVRGKSAGELLADALPTAVASMSFPKTMRWAAGTYRWVRPVHWILALHGTDVVPLLMFGVRATNSSVGHRFLGPRDVTVAHPDSYSESLERAYVMIEPTARRERLRAALERGAEELGGAPVADPALLDEIVDLVEWPGVVAGRFHEKFLDLPRELLVTTLRHHQKCFSIQDEENRLLPGFLAVANTESDPAGHIRRGNEWVVGGRLEDAGFFWKEDCETALDALVPKLDGVVFHAKCGTYADKTRRSLVLADGIGRALGMDSGELDAAVQATGLAKADLLTSLVGEFPELQGVVGGLLLEHEGRDPAVSRAVYEHYRPAGRTDAIPSSPVACVVALADKLELVAELIAAGERPTGSRDPLGLRRATNGIFRILLEGELPLTLESLFDLTGRHEELLSYLRERLSAFLRDSGYTANEILAATRPRVSDLDVHGWTMADIAARLSALKQVRGRDDFRHLVKLIERVDTILSRNAETLRELALGNEASPDEPEAAGQALETLLGRMEGAILEASEARRYGRIIDILSEFIAPVDRFFQDVLVLDPDNPGATLRRSKVLTRLQAILTRYFDIRELAGEAERSAS